MLLVDDKDSTCRSIQRFFEYQGFRVDCACEVEEAEALLANYPYEIVVSDMRLTAARGSEGLQILSYVHEHCPSTRTVMLTATENTEVEAEARNRGVDLSNEPASLDDLARGISRLLERASRRASIIDSVLDSRAITSVFQPAFEMNESADHAPGSHFVECLSRGPKGTNMESAGVLFEYARRKGKEATLDRICIEEAFRAISASRYGRRFRSMSTLRPSEREPDFPLFLAGLADRRRDRADGNLLEIVEHGPDGRPRASLAPWPGSGARRSNRPGRHRPGPIELPRASSTAAPTTSSSTVISSRVVTRTPREVRFSTL